MFTNRLKMICYFLRFALTEWRLLLGEWRFILLVVVSVAFPTAMITSVWYEYLAINETTLEQFFAIALLIWICLSIFIGNFFIWLYLSTVTSKRKIDRFLSDDDWERQLDSMSTSQLVTVVQVLMLNRKRLTAMHNLQLSPNDVRQQLIKIIKQRKMLLDEKTLAEKGDH